MSNIAIKIENLSKQYRLGVVGTGTLSHDLNRWWAKVRGKEDPFLKVGEVNDRATKGDSEFVWALQDINFEVKQGEVLGIIGKNGAGKSTLLKILSKVTGPTTGSIKARGRIASLLEVGTGFHPELTGRENIYLNGTILGMTKREVAQKLDEIVDFAGVARYLDTPVKRYSSGMMVRLGFAVAAHLEPEILVVDEVLAVGDAEFQKKAIGKMQDISKGEGRTILFVSHNMGSVKSLCDHGMVLENGKVVYYDSVDKAVSRYLSSENPKTPKFSLKDRVDRIGNGKLLFTDVSLFDGLEKKTNIIISGESMKLSLYYETTDRIKENEFVLTVMFKDVYNSYEMVSFRSDEMKPKFRPFGKTGKIDLKIPALYLRGANYNISLFAFEEGTGNEHALDIIDNVFSIRVLQGDLWKVGKVNRGYSSAIFPATFIN